jgi:hypothetical protein
MLLSGLSADSTAAAAQCRGHRVTRVRLDECVDGLPGNTAGDSGQQVDAWEEPLHSKLAPSPRAPLPPKGSMAPGLVDLSCWLLELIESPDQTLDLLRFWCC